MRPRKVDHHNLLEDIFAPDPVNNGVSEDDLLRLVEAARNARQRRRQAFASAAAGVAMIACGFALWPNQTRSVPTPIAAVPAPAKAETPAASITPPPVERIDDKTMLAMLGDRPAALVRWPDGRQGLLLLNAKAGGK